MHIYTTGILKDNISKTNKRDVRFISFIVNKMRTNAEPSLILKQESMFRKKNLTTKVVKS